MLQERWDMHSRITREVSTGSDPHHWCTRFSHPRGLPMTASYVRPTFRNRPCTD
jgi:hypothetical protein